MRNIWSIDMLKARVLSDAVNMRMVWLIDCSADLAPGKGGKHASSA